MLCISTVRTLKYYINKDRKILTFLEKVIGGNSFPPKPKPDSPYLKSYFPIFKDNLNVAHLSSKGGNRLTLRIVN